MLDQRNVNDFHHAIEVTVNDIRVFQDFNRPQVVQVDTAEVFAEEEIFDLALGGFVDVRAILIKELDIHNPDKAGNAERTTARVPTGR